MGSAGHLLPALRPCGHLEGGLCPPPTPTTIHTSLEAPRRDWRVRRNAEHLPRPCGYEYGQRGGKGKQEAVSSRERLSCQEGGPRGQEQCPGPQRVSQSSRRPGWVAARWLVFTRLHASRRPPLLRGAGPDPVPCTLVWRTKTAPQRTCRGG